MSEARTGEDVRSGPIQQRYQQLSTSREPFLNEARKCAALTIPSLYPPDGLSNGTKLIEPQQSVGAHGVKNLAEKIVFSLYPPGRPFFRLSVGQFDIERLIAARAAEEIALNSATPQAVEQFAEQMRPEITNEINKYLGVVEQAIIREFELQDNRSTDSEGVKHLIVGGSIIRYCPQDDDEQPRIYTLDQHVTSRNPDGMVREMITREGVDALTVEPEVREACGLVERDEVDTLTCVKKYDLYTRIKRSDDGKRWEVDQELNGVPVPNSEGSHDIDACPWVPLRWTKIDGEDYGRSYVSDYRGSLEALERLSEALLDSAAACARLLVLVSPNSQFGTKLRDVARAKNGAVIPGNAQDISFLRSDKYNDLRTPFEQIQMLTRQLQQAFLLNASVQRDAERVTASEIRAMVHELEVVLGGVYSTLGKEYQRPILINLMKRMQRTGKLPKLPKEVEPVIITGMDALGRSADLDRLMQLSQYLQTFQPAVIQEYTRFSDLARLGATALGLNPENIFKSEREVEQARQQAQQQALIQQAIGPAINAGAASATPTVQPQ